MGLTPLCPRSALAPLRLRHVQGDDGTAIINVAETAPYVHDGSLATLHDVIEHHEQDGTANPSLDDEIQPFRLTSAEQRQIIAFLKPLTEGPSSR